MRKLFFFFFCAICAANAGALQPSEASIKGTVKDITGAVIPGAEVTLLNPQQIALKAAITDAGGRYQFKGVGRGSYLVSVSQADFRSEQKPLTISHAGEVTLDFSLEINPLSAQVTISAETGLAADKNTIPQQVNVVSADSIQQRATGVLAQVAKEETGASLQRTSPTIGAVLVRGLTEVGVYVDGVRYTNSTQRGGINTFFNLNEPSSLQSVEIQRSPNTAQYGSDGLGGNVQLLSRQPAFGFDKPRIHGEFNAFYGSADNSFGSNALISYGAKRFGALGNASARRINTLRTGKGIDNHSAITRFLGLPSNILGNERLPDTAFTQFSGNFQLSFAPTDHEQFSFRYLRSQQDGGKRYDQLLGGDGNLIADLKNLMLDFGYLRYSRQRFLFFDSLSATISYNSQREERINQGGQGNPSATITNDKERTTTFGVSFFSDKHTKHNNFLIGSDYYRDRVSAPSFNTNPVTGSVTLVRPRVPDGATYDLFGLYVQDSWEAIPNRLRLSGALRYNVANYKSPAADIPALNGQPLFPDDSGRFKDFSGRIGAVATIREGLNAAFNFSRGFRAPNITSLGSLGLVGVGFQVSTSSVLGLGATVGTTADATAVSSGVAVSPLRSEVSNNYDISLRFRNKRFDGNLTAYLIDYKDSVVRQTLILPQGAVGRQLGSQAIISQNSNGAVFVSASTSPVLVQANFSNSRLQGVEFNADYRIIDSWTLGGNFSTISAKDKASGLPPNLGGGGVPPAMGFLKLRYQPQNKDFWIEGFINLAGRQDKLSTLDLGDRRTGAARSRNQIQNFFRRGACIRGLTTPGTNGQCNTPGGILIATGETLAQALNRVLPLGATINGVFIANADTAVPLFSAIPGYGLFNIRGGYRFSDKQQLAFAFENIADKSHRLPGWGIDGPGRSFTLQFRHSF